MATFRLYDCDIGFNIGDAKYQFDHVQSVTVDDPERTRLLRGANAGNNVGIVYREGLTEPKVVTTSALDIPTALFGVLGDAHAKQTRMDFWVISRSTGSSRTAKNAVLAQPPRQLTLDDSAESMQVTLEFQTFDLSEVHKDAAPAAPAEPA